MGRRKGDLPTLSGRPLVRRYAMVWPWAILLDAALLNVGQGSPQFPQRLDTRRPGLVFPAPGIASLLKGSLYLPCPSHPHNIHRGRRAGYTAWRWPAASGSGPRLFVPGRGTRRTARSVPPRGRLPGQNGGPFRVMGADVVHQQAHHLGRVVLHDRQHDIEHIPSVGAGGNPSTTSRKG